MQIGVYTFAEMAADPRTGGTISPSRRVQNLLEEIELADQVGLDVFGVGEHHRPDFAVSVPAVILGAAAARTRRIRLTSGAGKRAGHLVRQTPGPTQSSSALK